MKEYLLRRAAAEKMNGKVPGNYPCRSCLTAECCTKDVRLTIFDAQYILGAYQQGKISKKTAEQARRYAQDRQNNFCPFVNPETKKCTIYLHRPLLCMIYGYGLVLDSEDAFKEAFALSVIAKKDLGIDINEGKGFHMCEKGARELMSRAALIPIEVLLNFPIQQEYLNGIKDKQKMRLDRFAREVLLNQNASQRVLRTNAW